MAGEVFIRQFVSRELIYFCYGWFKFCLNRIYFYCNWI